MTSINNTKSVNTSKYPLALGSWGKEEIQAIQNVIKSDMYTMGEYVKKFENDFAKFFGSKYAVMVNSGSSANLLAVAALFYKSGKTLNANDEVIVPAVSWVTTYTPLQQYGLKVKFVDIDRDTLNFDLSALARAITPNTKMIFAVNLLGNPNDFKKIKEIIGDREIFLIEDNCESMGALFNKKQTGTFGIMGTYSSFFSHHISTMEGGMIVTDDEELAQILICLRAHGWTRHLPKHNKITGVKSDVEFEESFNFVLPGYNVRPIEMNGAIGIEQLKKLPEFVRVRRENAKYFVELFKNHPYIQIQNEIGESSWFGFSMVLKENAPKKRDQLINFLKEAEIECRPIVGGNFAKNKVVKFFNYEIFETLKNADYIDQHGLFVGNHHVDMKSQIRWLKDKIDLFFKS